MNDADDWKSLYLAQLSDCETRDKRLTDWEREFCSSLRAQIEKGKVPTQKQVDTLDRVWEKATKRG